MCILLKKEDLSISFFLIVNSSRLLLFRKHFHKIALYIFILLYVRSNHHQICMLPKTDSVLSRVWQNILPHSLVKCWQALLLSLNVFFIKQLYWDVIHYCKIPPFKVSNSMVCSIFPELYNHSFVVTQYNFRTFLSHAIHPYPAPFPDNH